MAYSRSLSLETRELLASLQSTGGSLFRRLWSKSNPVSLLHEVGRSNEPAAIPFLLDQTLASSSNVAEAANWAVASLLRALPTEEILWLDQYVRTHAPHRGPWQTLNPASLRAACPTDTSLFLATFHPSGYIRETALRLLPETRTGRELPFIIVRLNDWVRVVRETARDAFVARLRPQTAPYVVQSLPLIRSLERCGRADHSEVLSQTTAFLTSNAGMSALRDGLQSADKNVRRACFKVGSTLSPPALDRFLLFALETADSTVRVRAARIAVETSSNEQAAAIVPLLLRDSFAPVRIAALNLARRTLPDQERSMLKSCLLDRSASVRWYCQYHLKSIHSVDPVDHYRQAINTNQRSILVAAIYGLCEAGDKGDLDLVSPHFDNCFPSVRAASVRFIAVFGTADQKELVTRFLHDFSASVVRAACRALRSIGVTLRVHEMNEVLSESVDHHTRIVLLDLITIVSRWSQPQILIPACSDADKATRERASALLAQWLVTSASVGLRPSEDDLDGIRDAVDNHRHQLTERQISQLDFIMKVFSE